MNEENKCALPLNLQPIPVHMKSITDDYLLSPN